MSFKHDLKGKKFGKLTVKEYVETIKTKSFWKCICECGNEKIARMDNLKMEITTHCGCQMSFDHIRRRSFDKNYVVKENGCWEWIAVRNKGGYPKIGSTSTGHRYSFERYKGKIPKGKLVCHSCDNRGCVNPDHLFLGTHQENMDDCCRKKRQAVGEKTRSAKFKEKDVIKIITDYNTSKISMAELSRKYNVSYDTIFRIIKKTTWKHI